MVLLLVTTKAALRFSRMQTLLSLVNLKWLLTGSGVGVGVGMSVVMSVGPAMVVPSKVVRSVGPAVGVPSAGVLVLTAGVLTGSSEQCTAETARTTIT